MSKFEVKVRMHQGSVRSSFLFVIVLDAVSGDIVVILDFIRRLSGFDGGQYGRFACAV